MAISPWNTASKWVDGNGLLSKYAVNWLRELLTLINGAGNGSRLITVTYSATPVFAQATDPAARKFKIALTGNVTSSTATGLITNEEYLFIVTDSAGGHKLIWPTTFVNFPDISVAGYPSGLAAGAVVRAKGWWDGTNMYCIASMGDQ